MGSWSYFMYIEIVSILHFIENKMKKKVVNKKRKRKLEEQ